jgi:hypothetical protein
MPLLPLQNLTWGLFYVLGYTFFGTFYNRYQKNILKSLYLYDRPAAEKEVIYFNFWLISLKLLFIFYSSCYIHNLQFYDKLHTYIPLTLCPERVEAASQIFLRDTHVLPQLLSYEKYCRRDRW